MRGHVTAPSGNELTLAAYEGHADTYVATTPSEIEPYWHQWLDEIMALRPPGSPILEIGSGPGHDASYMEDQGAVVRRTDAAMSFVTRLRDQGFEDTRQLNLLTDQIDGLYGMVYAFAVLPHFTVEECGVALEKMAGCLAEGGIVAVTARRGRGMRVLERKGMPARRFTFVQPGLLWVLAEDCGLRVLSMRQHTTIRDGEEKTWLALTAEKA